MAGHRGDGMLRSWRSPHGCPGWPQPRRPSVRPSSPAPAQCSRQSLVPPPCKLLPAVLLRTLQSPSPAHLLSWFLSAMWHQAVQSPWVEGAEGGRAGREESGVLRANPRSSALESHSSPGEHRATLHIALASPTAAGSAGEPAASQPSRCASRSALLSSLEINVCFLAWACWQQGSSVGVPHPLGGSWPDMAGAGWSPAAILALIWGRGLVCRRGCCKHAQLFCKPMKYLT